MRELDYRFLGPLEVVADGEPLPLGRRQQRAVLAILLLHAGSAVSTDRLVDLLWPEKPPGRPQTAIQGYVSGLRKLLGRETIETHGAAYVLRVDLARLDAEWFERLLERGRRAREDGRAEQAALDLAEALALWRGPALADFAYDSWAQSPIGRLEELRWVAREELVEARLALGEHAQLVGDLEALVDEQPLRERPRAQLMLALYRAGRQADALDVYHQTRARLADELGIDPSAELQALYKQILNQDEALAEPAAATPRTNLPTAPNRLIGRGRELDELRSLLRRDDVRLVTLTGPGGSGKTRLALASATELVGEEPDGVWLVDLAPVRDPALVAPTIARTVTEQDRLDGALAGKRLLLLLDNFEHVSAAAVDVARLLRAEPGVKALVTSREPLHLAGEREYPVPPLPEADAVELFVDRARAVDAAFETDANVAEICRRLDGLPLAIQLAAARSKVLTPAALLARLVRRLPLLTHGPRDLPERQQTLRATMEWSYELLSPDEQRLFARLGVFAGGCSLEAAEAICGADLDTLSSLVDRSLVRRVDDRFRMLETIREYAEERLVEAEAERNLRSRHLDYFLELAERAAPELRGPNQRAWLRRLRDELPNLRAALDRAEQPESAIRLAVALSSLWDRQGLHIERRTRLEDAVERCSTLPESRLKAFHGIAYAANRQGDLVAAKRAAERALALAGELGQTEDVRGAGPALTVLAMIATTTGDLEEASALYERTLRLARAQDWRHGEAVSLGNLADVALARAAYDEARRHADAACALFAEIGDRMRVGDCVMNRGFAELELGLLDAGESSLTTALQIHLETGDEYALLAALIGLAAASHARGDPARAVREVTAIESRRHDLGLELCAHEQRLVDRVLGGGASATFAPPTDAAALVHEIASVRLGSASLALTP